MFPFEIFIQFCFELFIELFSRTIFPHSSFYLTIIGKL